MYLVSNAAALSTDKAAANGFVFAVFWGKKDGRRTTKNRKNGRGIFGARFMNVCANAPKQK